MGESPSGSGPTVVVLGGPTNPGTNGPTERPEDGRRRRDVVVAGAAGMGVQLESIRRGDEGEFLVIVAGGAYPGAVVERLLGHMRTHDDVALIGPCASAEEQGVGLEEVESVVPYCAAMRRVALEAIGGFETGFRTVAVLDEAARGGRARGWRTVRALDCLVEPPSDLLLGDPELIHREREAVRALARGDRLKAADDREGAAEAYYRALAAKGDFVEVILVLGALLLETGRPAEAVEVVRRLVGLEGRSVQAHNYLGLVQYQARDWDGARRSFQQVLELDPDYVEALVNLSVLEWEQGDADLALDLLERAAALDPANREIIVNAALIHFQLGDAPAAVDLLQGYAEAHPEDVEVRAVLADTLRQSGDAAGARRAAEQVLKMQPGHARALDILQNTREQEEEGPPAQE